MASRKRKSSYKRRGTRRRSSYKKGSYRRRRSSFWKRPTRRTAPKLFPDVTRVIFQTTAAWEPATDNITGGTSFFIEAANIGDPFGTISSVLQPTGLDQWAGFYNKYIVNGVSLSIKATNPNITDVEDLTYTIHPSVNNGYSETSYATRYPYDIPYARSKTVTFRNPVPVYLKHYASSRKMLPGWGIQNSACVGSFTPTSNTPPSQDWHFNVRAWNAFNPTIVAQGRAIVTVKQYVTLFNRIDLAASTQG